MLLKNPFDINQIFIKWFYISSTTNLISAITDLSVYQERQKLLESNYSEVSQKLVRGSIILNNCGRTTENTTPGLEVTSEESS